MRSSRRLGTTSPRSGPAPVRLVVPGFALLSLLACDGAADASDPSATTSASAGNPEASRPVPASGGSTQPQAQSARAPRDPRLDAVVRAIERGRAELAWTLLEPLGRSTIDARLAHARASLLEGDAVGALREVEDASRLTGEAGDDRVDATRCEIFAATGEHHAAEDGLRAALRIFGRTAPLERARGVIHLVRPGGATEGLTALERALELDPELPYCSVPLFQARLIVGRQRLSAEDPAGALALAQAARTFDPVSLQALELTADAHAALGELDEALALYAELEAEGRDFGVLRADLHKQAGMQAILSGDNPAALDHFRAARRLGLSDELLGHGADALAEEAQRAIDTGIELYEGGDLEAALVSFRAALRDDPRSLEAKNHEAVCLFRLERFADAGGAFEGVLEEARARGIELPEPVHLNAARAWKLAGRDERARAVAQAYLDGSPEGPWAEETRNLLIRLD